MLRKFFLIFFIFCGFNLFSNDDTTRYVIDIKPLDSTYDIFLDKYFKSVIMYSKLDNGRHQITFAFPYNNPDVGLVIVDKKGIYQHNNLYKSVDKGDIVNIVPGNYIFIFTFNQFGFDYTYILEVN